MLRIASISFIVPLIGEQPGVFGWLMMRNSSDVNGSIFVEPLTVRRSALTVGVYDDTAKSEIQEPGADFSSRVLP